MQAVASFAIPEGASGRPRQPCSEGGPRRASLSIAADPPWLRGRRKRCASGTSPKPPVVGWGRGGGTCGATARSCARAARLRVADRPWKVSQASGPGTGQGNCSGRSGGARLAILAGAATPDGALPSIRSSPRSTSGRGDAVARAESVRDAQRDLAGHQRDRPSARAGVLQADCAVDHERAALGQRGDQRRRSRSAGALNGGSPLS